jgi:hypothetical protein
MGLAEGITARTTLRPKILAAWLQTTKKVPTKLQKTIKMAADIIIDRAIKAKTCWSSWLSPFSNSSGD